MGIKILIVEDLFIEANDLSLDLQRAGHAVTGIAKSVSQALGMLKKERPDLVLLDIFLKGDLTGIQLAKVLGASGIPFIFLSANSNASTLEAAKATQPHGFLVKPYRQKDLLIALDIAVYRHRLALEVQARQEQWLTQLLNDILQTMATAREKVLLLAKAFLPFISFDLLMVDTELGSGTPSSLHLFRRSGFDQFDDLSPGELLKKTRLTPAELDHYRKNELYTREIVVRNVDDTGPGMCKKVIERFRHVYGVRSGLFVPILINGIPGMQIVFFSREPEAYAGESAELIGPLKPLLAAVLQNIREASVATGAGPYSETFSRGALVNVDGIIGKSPRLLQVLEMVTQVAPMDTTVLVTGETGVGKEGLATAIHRLSSRNGGPLVKVNCAALPEDLIESELFGHERGAFTSAVDRRIGKFEQAQGGTLFLDEIGEIPLLVQSKLLRVLQEKELERLGGKTTIKVDVRIIAATNRVLHKEVAEGRFRMDLYYRINVFPVQLPPLRERKEDIPLLVEHFLRQAAAPGTPPKVFAPEVMRQLIEYPWPGNIRELQHFVERQTLLTHPPLIASVELPDVLFALPSDEAISPAGGSPNEKEMILAALKNCNGKVSGKGGAAELLGIKSSTLAARMRRLGIAWRFAVLLLAFLGMAVCAAAQADTVRIESLLRSGCSYLLRPGSEKNDLDSGFFFFNQALTLGRAGHSDKWTDSSLYWKGRCYLEARDVPHGKACFQEVIATERRRGDKKGEAGAWAWLADGIPISAENAAEKEQYYQQAIQLYRAGGDTLLALSRAKRIADMHLILNRLDLAEKELLEIVDEYRAVHFRRLHYTYDLLRAVYKLRGDLAKETFYTMEMVRSMESTDSGDSRLALSALYGNAADSYTRAGIHDRGLVYACRSVRQLAPETSQAAIGYIYYNDMRLAVLNFLALDSPRQALDFIAETVRRRSPADTVQRSMIDWARGASYMALGDLGQADREFAELRACYRGSITLYGTYEPELGVDDLLAMGNFYFVTRQYGKAGLMASRLIPKKVDLVTLEQYARIERFRSRVDSAQGRYLSAMQHYQAYQRLNDSLFGVQKIVQIQELQIKYATEQKDKDLRIQAGDIRLLTKQNQLQQVQAEKSRNFRNMMMGGLALLLLLTGVVYNRYRLKQQKNRQLEMKQKEITTKNIQLERLLHENEWLLREVHHRVKNNLQVIMSLLKSQSAYLRDEAALNAIMESRHRVQAMSLIHQKLYKSQNTSHIGMPEYIGELVDYLRDSFEATGKVAFELQIQRISLDVLQAVPVGLILNEAITNSFKYAFPWSEEDRITIHLSLSEAGRVHLLVADNGRGLPPDFDPARNHSFGMLLIRGLTEDLDGTLQLETGGGTAYHVRFHQELSRMTPA